MLRKIASGGYGNVFLRKSGRKKTNVLKKIKSRNEFGRRITNTQTNLSHECRIARKIHKYVPKHIINIKKCTSKYMYMNYHRSGTVENWLMTKPKSLTDSNLMRVIKQVITTLAVIHTRDRL